jgi:hypothetical protein
MDRAEPLSTPVRTSGVSCGWNGKDGNVSENQLDHADQSEKKAAVLSASEAIELIFRQAAEDDEETEEQRKGESDRTEP